MSERERNTIRLNTLKHTHTHMKNDCFRLLKKLKIKNIPPCPFIYWITYNTDSNRILSIVFYVFFHHHHHHHFHIDQKKIVLCHHTQTHTHTNTSLWLTFVFLRLCEIVFFLVANGLPRKKKETQPKTIHTVYNNGIE